MRILLLSQFYPPIVGGEERHVYNLAIALSRRGHQVSVATLWYPGAAPLSNEAGIRVHRIRGTLQRLSGLFAESERRHAPPFPDPELVIALRQVIAQEQPEIVHAHNWLLASYLPLKSWAGAPLVTTLHDYGLICAKKNFMHQGRICGGPRLSQCVLCARTHYGAIKGTVTALGNFMSIGLTRRVVDKFIPVSHAVARHTRLAAAGAPFEVIPNFVPDDVGRAPMPIDPCLRELPDDGYILFVGDLMHLKGVDVLLHAYTKLKRAPPLVLIGRRCADTPTELPPNVHMFHLWPHSAVIHAWRRCSFGVAPSVGPEACATVVMEAMAAGKPVIATNIGGMPDLIDHGETGLLVPAGDAHALTKSMQWLLDRPELIAKMGSQGLARVEHLKATSVVSRIERVYEEVLRDKRAASRTPAAIKHSSGGATEERSCGR